MSEEKNYKDVVQEFWNPKKENDSVAGIYVSGQEEVGENKSNVYNLEKSDGKVMSVWGSTVLDNRMKLVKIGDDLNIIYLGLVEPEKGREYKDFKIQKAEVESN